MNPSPTTKYSQGDIIHVEATVEVDGGEIANVVIKGLQGNDYRCRIPKSLVRSHERGPIKAGDKVKKSLKGKGKLEGTVLHREGDLVWVKWGDEAEANTVEDVSILTR